MKANTSALVKKGFGAGILSGMTWGLDTVLIGVAMAMAPFTENPLLVIGGTFICSMLHDTFAAFWMFVIMGHKGKLKELKCALFSKDGVFCMIGALFGAISTSGPALTATVTSIYPLLGSALALIILKEKITLKGWIGLCICVLGIVYIGYSPNNETNNILIGILFALIAAIGWATEGVVCGYGMKSGKVDPYMALLIRESTSAVIYILLITPIMLGGYSEMIIGTKAIVEYIPCITTLFFTALIGMSSFLMWYTGIDLIGAAKALCLNVTYSFWAVVFSFLIIGGYIMNKILLSLMQI